MAELKHNINYPIAKNHQIIQILPQFKPIKRGARKKGVERVYSSQDGRYKAKIKMFKELDIADQDLLLTILAIALPVKRGSIINEETKHQDLWKKLAIKQDDTNQDITSIMIETTPFELLKELNKNTGKKDYLWLLESLERLSDTTLLFDTPEFIGSTNLLSFYLHKETKKLLIAINPLNALVLMNDKKGYILNNRIERLQLKSDVAKALHSVLLTLIDNKQSKTFSLDTFVEKVYLSTIEEMTSQARKDSRRSIKNALMKINELKNWDITIHSNKTVTIKRIYN